MLQGRRFEGGGGAVCLALPCHALPSRPVSLERYKV